MFFGLGSYFTENTNRLHYKDPAQSIVNLMCALLWGLRVEYQRSADLIHAATEACNHDCQSAATIHRNLLVCIVYNMERHAEMLNAHGCESSGQ
jgi:hypothetical protein